jgi:hypothetical protein
VHRCVRELLAALPKAEPARPADPFPVAAAKAAVSLPVSEEDERIVDKHMAEVTAGHEVRPLTRRAEETARTAEPNWISVKDRLPLSGYPVRVDGGRAYYDALSGHWVSMVETPHRVIQWEVTRWADERTGPDE